MSFDQIFGWAMTLLSQFGFDNVLRVVGFVAIATIVYRAFISRGE